MATKATHGVLANAGPRNVIINGNMEIWQRGTSFATLSASAHLADRFRWLKLGAGTGVVTVNRSTDVPDPVTDKTRGWSNYSLHVDVTTADAAMAAGDAFGIYHVLEGYNYGLLAGGDATLSFWVKATKTGTYCVSFRNSNIDRSYVVEYTVDVADTWEKKSVTVPLTETGGTWDYTNGIGLYITWALASGTNFHGTADTWNSANDIATSNQVNALDNVANNFRIARVQFEAGDIATELELETFDQVLVKCQRYYQKYDSAYGDHTYLRFAAGVALTATTSEFPFHLPVIMRSAPTVTFDGTASNFAAYMGGVVRACTSLTTQSRSKDIVTFLTTVASGQTIGHAGTLIANNNNNAWTAFDAELT